MPEYEINLGGELVSVRKSSCSGEFDLHVSVGDYTSSLLKVPSTTWAVKVVELDHEEQKS